MRTDPCRTPNSTAVGVNIADSYFQNGLCEMVSSVGTVAMAVVSTTSNNQVVVARRDFPTALTVPTGLK